MRFRTGPGRGVEYEFYKMEVETMFGRHFHDFERHSRLFEKGDLKYVILDLLKDKPAHGYEIIRALEAHFHGFYSPSPGSVYPTLQLLEDMDCVKSVEQDGKKVYTITAKGQDFLKEREETIDRIKDHMRGWCGFENRQELQEIFHKLRNIGRDIGHKARQIDAAKISRIKEIVVKACGDIEDVIQEEK
jgi:DNA-binding PadR family transcriptional regulator